MYTSPGMNQLAMRGVAGFGVPVLTLLVLAATTGWSPATLVLAAGPLAGLAGGLSFGRRVSLPVVLMLSFGLIGAMFWLQDGRSANLIDVVYVGFVAAFVFWVVGLCATLALPAPLRFHGAFAFAMPGGIAGMTFQFFYGPARFALGLGSRAWWTNAPWEHFILWLIAGTGTGWLLGLELHRVQAGESPKDRAPGAWAAASLILGLFGLTIAAIFFARARLPLGLHNSLSPASVAGDWYWSWGLLTFAIAAIGLRKSFRSRKGRSFAAAGIILSVTLLFGAQRISANSRKIRFNIRYAESLLSRHGQPTDPEFASAAYTGNLILAQAALDNGDTAAAGRHLLQAAAAPGTPAIQQNGPDTTVARLLLQRGERDMVVEYLRRCRNLWPQGVPLLNRWETAIRAGRQPNFNNRVINPTDASPERR